MKVEFENHPENLVIPIELTNKLYQDYQADFIIIDRPSYVYGKVLHGNAKIKFKNGNYFEGELHNGMLHGQGVLTWKSGVRYSGEFYYNAVQGKGTYEWPDNSRYSGDVVNGIRHGVGTFLSNDGDAEYTGDWVNGLRHGQGVIRFQSGAIFEGTFVEGCKDGHGKMTYPSGNYYDGEWKQDVKEGKGTMVWKSTREKYYGTWKNNLQNGFGVHIWLEERGEGKMLRNRYEGQWLNGMRQGYGTFYYANGSKYEGQWDKNLKEGYAIFTEDNGNLIQGFYKADRFVKPEEPLPSIQIASNISSVHEKNHPSSNKRLSQAGQSITEKVVAAVAGNAVAAAAAAATAANHPKILHKPANQRVSEAAIVLDPTQPDKQRIEQNQYKDLVDFSDLVCASDKVERDLITVNVQTMLLRHNSSLKSFYKLYSTNNENRAQENSFSMDMRTFWRLMREAKVLDATVTLASINRIFYEGVKNRYRIESDSRIVQRQVELAKSIGRPLTQEELRDIVFVDTFKKNHTGKSQAPLQPEDFQKHSQSIQLIQYDDPMDEKQLHPVSLEVIDIHDSSRVILFRHFVELVIRVSLLKYSDLINLHRCVEKLIVSKIQPVFEQTKQLQQQQQQIPQPHSSKKIQLHPKSVHSFDELEPGYGKKRFMMEHFKQSLHAAFDVLKQEKKNPKFGLLDYTVQFKHLFKLMQDCGFIGNEADKKILIQQLERNFDPVSTIAHVEVLLKEKEKEDKDKERKDMKDKKKKAQGKLTEQQKQQAALLLAQSNADRFDKLRDTRSAILFEMELLPQEFEEIICLFLVKKEKELMNSKDDNDLAKKAQKFFEVINTQVSIAQRIEKLKPPIKKNPPRVWPSSIKDKLKEQLAVDKLRKEEFNKAKKLKDQERRKEQQERAKMELEDLDINSDIEFAHEDDDDNDDDY